MLGVTTIHGLAIGVGHFVAGRPADDDRDHCHCTGYCWFGMVDDDYLLMVRCDNDGCQWLYNGDGETVFITDNHVQVHVIGNHYSQLSQ